MDPYTLLVTKALEMVSETGEVQYIPFPAIMMERHPILQKYVLSCQRSKKERSKKEMRFIRVEPKDDSSDDDEVAEIKQLVKIRLVVSLAINELVGKQMVGVGWSRGWMFQERREGGIILEGKWNTFSIAKFFEILEGLPDEFDIQLQLQQKDPVTTITYDVGRDSYIVTYSDSNHRSQNFSFYPGFTNWNKLDLKHFGLVELLYYKPHPYLIITYPLKLIHQSLIIWDAVREYALDKNYLYVEKQNSGNKMYVKNVETAIEIILKLEREAQKDNTELSQPDGIGLTLMEPSEDRGDPTLFSFPGQSRIRTSVEYPQSGIERKGGLFAPASFPGGKRRYTKRKRGRNVKRCSRRNLKRRTRRTKTKY